MCIEIFGSDITKDWDFDYLFNNNMLHVIDN